MKSYVYVIECRVDESSSKNNPVKIGYTKNLKKRLAELQVGNHFPLYLLAAVAYETEEEAREKEAHYHTMFKRHNLRGEWFKPIVKEGAALGHFYQLSSIQQRQGKVPSITNLFLAKIGMTEAKRAKLGKKHARRAAKKKTK